MKPTVDKVYHLSYSSTHNEHLLKQVLGKQGRKNLTKQGFQLEWAWFIDKQVGLFENAHSKNKVNTVVSSFGLSV